MRKRKFLGVLLSLVLMAGVIPAAAFATDTGEELVAGVFDISKSKEAAQLEKSGDKYESTVTLSLPSKEKQMVTDVVFVLDKSMSADLEDEALSMLKDLKSEIRESGAKVNVGVVIFNKVANVTAFKDLATEYDDIEKAIRQEVKSGTNTHAGLIAGKKMLDADTDVPADRKYLVFVSDGITYMFNEEPTVVAWSFTQPGDGGTVNTFAGPDNWSVQYSSNDAPEDWAAVLAEIGKKIEAQGEKYDYMCDSEPAEFTDVNRQTEYANSVEKALYLTAEEYSSIEEAGYHCYAIEAQSGGNAAAYKWGPSFMRYLADGKTVDFSQIKNDILYLVDHGSSITDYMGYVDGDYNFDLKDLESITLTVNGEKLDAVIDKEENMVMFGNEQFMLEYFPADDGEEHFVLNIYQPVKITEPVQLTYKVVLQNPKTEAGTYGRYDKYGTNGYDGLFTNNTAFLTPVDSEGNVYAAQEFNKPTVSYTVGAPAPVPEDKPSAGKTDTGDDSSMTVWIAAAALSGLALAAIIFAYRRKRA